MIISLASEKGGVGKSTLSLAIAFELAMAHKVLMVDSDLQESIGTVVSMRDKPLPSNLSFESFQELTLHKEIAKISKNFEHVIIDTPSRLTDVTRAALTVSDLIIIPCRPCGVDGWAAQKTLELIKNRPNAKKRLKVVIVINQKGDKLVLNEKMKKFFKSLKYDFYLAKSEITARTIFAKSISLGLSVQEMDKEKKASKEINQLVSEIFDIAGGHHARHKAA